MRKKFGFLVERGSVFRYLIAEADEYLVVDGLLIFRTGGHADYVIKDWLSVGEHSEERKAVEL